MTDPSIQSTPPGLDAESPRDLSLVVPGFASPQPFLQFTIIFGVIHAVLWCACIGLLVFYVPHAQRLFRDYNMTLPAMTLFVFELSRLADAHFQLMPLLLGFWLLFEVPVMAILRHNSRRAGWAWGILHTILPLLFLALIVSCIELPKLKLLDGLSR